jgi:hypothetical protein
MKINELRIGNYISPLGRGITVVEGLCIWDGLIQSSNFAERGIEDFEPIPLTEEWLLKFGATEKYKSVSNRWSFGIFALDDPEDEDGILTNEFYYDSTLKVKYVHQLQNLYFALTGEELTIKSKE